MIIKIPLATLLNYANDEWPEKSKTTSAQSAAPGAEPAVKFSTFGSAEVFTRRALQLICTNTKIFNTILRLYHPFYCYKVYILLVYFGKLKDVE